MANAIMWILSFSFFFFFLFLFNTILQRQRTLNNNEPTERSAFAVFRMCTICIATRIWTMELSHLIIIVNLILLFSRRRVQLVDDNLDLLCLHVCSVCSHRRVNILKLKLNVSVGRHKNDFSFMCVLFRREALDWIQFPYYILLKQVAIAQRPKTRCSTDQFLIAKKRYRKIPAVEIRKSIACNPIDMTMWEKEWKKRKETEPLCACGGNGLRTMAYFISFYYLCTNFIYSAGQFYFPMEFIFIAALRLIYLRRSYWNIK